MEMLDTDGAMLTAAEVHNSTCGEAELGDCCVSPGAANRNRRSRPSVIDRVDRSLALAPATIWHLRPVGARRGLIVRGKWSHALGDVVNLTKDGEMRLLQLLY